MRLLYFFLPFLFWAHQTLADAVQVPLQPDGTVDLERVYQEFQLAFPIYENGARPTEFSGMMLGESFAGQLIAEDLTEGFVLARDAPTLSEHGNFLIAVLATDIICLRNELVPGLVLWQDTAKHNDVTWQVSSSCSSPPD